MKTLINMELTAEEAKELYEPKPGDAPKYPWGLSLCLENDQLEKLGITGKLPETGTVMQLVARVEVTNTGDSKSQNGEDRRSISLQVTDMSLAPEGSDPAKALYGAAE